MDGLVLARIAAAVEAAPDAIALERDGRRWTYRELWAAAARCAAHLRGEGVGSGDLVALRLPRGIELASGVLGSWLAEAAYLPLDPSVPDYRREQVLADAAPLCMLDLATWDDLPDGAAIRNDDIPRTTGPELAYVIYTSGSTGRPKGVEIHHAALDNLVSHLAAEVGMESGVRMLWLTQFSFDMSVPELFLPLAFGGTCVVAADEVRANARLMADAVRRGDPSIVQATPSTWRVALEHPDLDLDGRIVMLGGEPSTPELIEALVDRGARVLHCYGPTETTVWSTMAWIAERPGYPVPVGTPISRTVVTCVDEAGRLVPDGEQGEIWISGTGVALGYRHRPELTAERFIDHRELGRTYRTGDLGRWNDAGELELFGRADRQVKLRGNRIELGDIEAAVCLYPRVHSVAAELVGPLDDQRLAVLVVAADTDAAELLAHCRATLPPSMVPSTFRFADAMPLNVNQKIDHAIVRELLAETSPPGSAELGAYQPELPEELIDLAAVWRELLPGADVEASTNFFLAGGHSLLAAVCLQRIERDWGVSVDLEEFFGNPTLAALAGRIGVHRCAGSQ